MDVKMNEAREFLKAVEMPVAQQTDLCCYVILALITAYVVDNEKAAEKIRNSPKWEG